MSLIATKNQNHFECDAEGKGQFQTFVASHALHVVANVDNRVGRLSQN